MLVQEVDQLFQIAGRVLEASGANSAGSAASSGEDAGAPAQNIALVAINVELDEVHIPGVGDQFVKGWRACSAVDSGRPRCWVQVGSPAEGQPVELFRPFAPALRRRWLRRAALDLEVGFSSRLPRSFWNANFVGSMATTVRSGRPPARGASCRHRHSPRHL